MSRRILTACTYYLFLNLFLFLGRSELTCVSQSVPPAQVQCYRGPWVSSSHLWNHSVCARHCSQPCIKPQLHRRLMYLRPFRPAMNFSFSVSLTSGKSTSKEPAAAVALTGRSTVPSQPLAPRKKSMRTGEGMEQREPQVLYNHSCHRNSVLNCGAVCQQCL